MLRIVSGCCLRLKVRLNGMKAELLEAVTWTPIERCYKVTHEHAAQMNSGGFCCPVQIHHFFLNKK